MKRILIFSLAYFPHVGGAEIAVKEITDRIRPDDIEFHMMTLRFDSGQAKEEKIGNVFVHRVGDGSGYLSKIFFTPRAAWRAQQLNQNLHFDAAWAIMSYMLLPLLLLRMLGVQLPYVLTLQEGDTYRHMFQRLRILPFIPMLNRGFRGAAVVQTISTYLGTWARRKGYKGPLEIIPNGVSVQDFGGDIRAARINEVADALGKKMGDVFLITTSRLVHKNAIDDVVRALSLLPANVHFVVVGGGPDETMLKKLAQKLKVEERVRFVGPVEYGKLPAYLKAADIFVRPSRSEGMGNSFIEAMAVGLPVVATQEGGIADFLFDEKRNPNMPVTGWAVDKNSPAQIVVAVSDIMSHPEKMRAVVATAKRMVSEKYDWDGIARAMRTRVFGRVLNELH